jgi:predicted Ser/Thr protein kinase
VTQIGKYQVVEQVGEGAMGVVYRAKDPVLNRTVAIKVMSEGLAQDASLRERFLREAQAAGSLQHPNLVTIYDFGETEGHLFIAMEYIEGADLEQLMLQKSQMSLAAKLDLIIDVLNGLSFAHRRGIIHRDIKPANIRIDQEGRARIMDFGVAKLEKSNLTGTGMMMGTPNYMAPEQITGGELTPSVDLWSVGAMLYELISSKKPFAADTLHRVLFRIVSEPPSELMATNPGLPSALDHVIKKSLEKDPANRYKTASEMANALAAVRATLGAPRLSRTVSQRSSIEERLKLAAKATQGDASSGKRPMLPVTIGVVAGIVLATVGIVLGLTRDQEAGIQSGAPASIPAPAVTPSTSTSPPPLAVVIPPVAQETPRQASPPSPRQSKAAETKTKVAETKVAETKVAETKVAESNTPVRDSTPVTPPPVQQVQAPVVVPPPPAPVARDTTPTVVSPPVDHRPAINAIVESYARSIATRNVADVKRIYVGMTPQQQSAWESFFSSIRSITATLELSSLQITGNNAVGRLSGAYQFVSRAGRTETQPANFQATFAREGERWTLQSIR